MITEGEKRFFRTLLFALLVGLLSGLARVLAGQATADSAKAQAILRRHHEAIGGDAAMLAVTDEYMAVTMRKAGGPAVVTMRTWRSGALVYHQSDVPGVGRNEYGHDGRIAWSYSAALGADILERLPGEMPGMSAISTDAQPSNAVWIGQREFGGKRYDAVRVVRPSGTTISYFDIATGLLAGMDIEQQPGPPGQMSMSFHGYKRIGKRLYATEWTVRTADGKEMITRIDSVSHEPIDRARFEPPPAVRELVARKKNSSRPASP